jgi:phosphoribosylformimino-5-aminoimidazole carboxamide ribonucleotide (ProFAR) isomerase
VDREGLLQGINLDWFHKLRWATRLPITAGGGIRSRTEVVAVAKLKMKDTAGMELYRNRLH